MELFLSNKCFNYTIRKTICCGLFCKSKHLIHCFYKKQKTKNPLIKLNFNLLIFWYDDSSMFLIIINSRYKSLRVGNKTFPLNFLCHFCPLKIQNEERNSKQMPCKNKGGTRFQIYILMNKKTFIRRT